MAAFMFASQMNGFAAETPAKKDSFRLEGMSVALTSNEELCKGIIPCIILQKESWKDFLGKNLVSAKLLMTPIVLDDFVVDAFVVYVTVGRLPEVLPKTTTENAMRSFVLDVNLCLNQKKDISSSRQNNYLKLTPNDSQLSLFLFSLPHSRGPLSLDW